MSWKRIVAFGGATVLTLLTFISSPAMASEAARPGTTPFASRLSIVSPADAIPMTCNILADTPYAKNGMVWVGGTYSGCVTPYTVTMMWDLFGPNQIMHQKTDAQSGWHYGWYCTWGSPQNRVLYTEARDYTGKYDDSTTASFTSSSSDCLF